MVELGHPKPNIHRPCGRDEGKGSVSALCASALQAAGYKVGLYTSPHLLDYTERIQINGQPVSHQGLVDLVEQVKPAVAKIPKLTTFEITTALGYLYFANQNVDAAVIEVGLGGRLDATNVVMPKVSVITSLSYDHMAVLGNTLALIAGEKAGIIKPACRSSLRRKRMKRSKFWCESLKNETRRLLWSGETSLTSVESFAGWTDSTNIKSDLGNSLLGIHQMKMQPQLTRR